MSAQTIDALRARVTGPVITEGDPGYDEARKVYNFMIDRHPAAVVSCATAADVAAVVRHAAQTGSDLAVRGGGHDVAGHGVCNGGLVLDLSPMRAVAVDAEARTARVDAGATWGEFDAATAAFGLATTGAQVSAVGVAGFRLRRAHQIHGHPMPPRPLDGGRFVRATASGRPETPHSISLIIPAGSGKIGFKNVW